MSELSKRLSYHKVGLAVVTDMELCQIISTDAGAGVRPLTD